MNVKEAFARELVTLPFEQLLPVRKVPDTMRRQVRYQRILSSMKEIGLVEPLVVEQRSNERGQHLLLDGHLRLDVARSLGWHAITCMFAPHDDSFTYNMRVNRLATVQESLMIQRALERGVPEDRLARALNFQIKQLRRRRNVLQGVCDTAADLLKHKSISMSVFENLRKLTAYRQIEIAELMIAADNFSAAYAKALVVASKPQHKVKSDRSKSVEALTPEQLSRMEREMSAVQADLKAVEANYGENILALVVIAGFVGRVLKRPKLRAYLDSRHQHLLKELDGAVAAASLESAG